MEYLIYVCDAVMGSGKTSAAINFMNANISEHFLYVTPFTDETERIQNACGRLHFKLPSNKKEQTNHQKREDIKNLLRYKENISLTHSLLSLCDQEAIRLIKDNNYTMILDEAIDVMTAIEAKPDDVQMAMSSPWFNCDTSILGTPQDIVLVDPDKKYTGNWMKELVLYSRSHRLVALQDNRGNDKLYCLSFNEQIMQAPTNTYILTYLFEASPLSCLLSMHHIEHSNIGISIDPKNEYQFSLTGTYIPEYVKTLKSKIHIEGNKKLNAIGEDGKRKHWNAFSIGWQKRALQNTENGYLGQMKKNLNNYFRNIHGDIPSSGRMWTCYSELQNKLSGKGYTNRYLAFNARAVNDWRDARVMAYCMNVFMPLWEQSYYRQHGVVVNSDLYALSTMIQWIWRSAIRDGKEIWIYVPSRRMRTLLENWINEVSGQALPSPAAEQDNTNIDIISKDIKGEVVA